MQCLRVLQVIPLLSNVYTFTMCVSTKDSPLKLSYFGVTYFKLLAGMDYMDGHRVLKILKIFYKRCGNEEP